MEWSLHQDIANLIFHQWGQPKLYLITMRMNTKYPTFMSSTPGRDFAYGFPPQQILTQVLQNQPDNVLHPHPNSPILAKTDMVPGSPKTNPGSTNPVNLMGEDSNAG